MLVLARSTLIDVFAQKKKREQERQGRMLSHPQDKAGRKSCEVTGRHHHSHHSFGHGYFNACLAKIGKVEDATCPYDDSTEDDAHHVQPYKKIWDS